MTADLAISGGITPNPVMVRDRYTITLTVTNNGPLNATGVTLRDIFPTGSNSISASTTQGSCGAPSNGRVTCSLGNLTANANATITLTGIARSTGALTNQATVSGGQTDSQLGNNSATQTVTAVALSCNGKTPTIVGTPGNDTLRGASRADVIQGLGGNDTLSGGESSDTICGGEGQDVLKGERGNDALDGGAGTDSCDGGTGTDSSINCEAKTSIP